MIRRIIFLGLPGSGKGTQSLLLGKEFNLFILSTGEVFRNMIREGKDEIADQIRLFINKGMLVSDKLTFEIVKNALPSDKSWILDGFPRNLNQAKMLDEFCPPTDVIFVHVDEKIIFNRLTGRRIAKKSGKMYNIYLHPPQKEGFCDETGEELLQRNDDQPEIVQKRLQIYQEETEPLIEYYRNKKVLHIIKGDFSINEVYKNLKEVLKLYGR